MSVRVSVRVSVSVVLCAILYTASATYLVAEDFLRDYEAISPKFQADATLIRASIVQHHAWKTALWNTDEEELLVLAAEHHCRYHAIADADEPPPRSKIVEEYAKMSRLAADFDERYGMLETLVQEVELTTRRQLKQAFKSVAADEETGNRVFGQLRETCGIHLSDKCNRHFFSSFFVEVLLTRPSVAIDCQKAKCKAIQALHISEADKVAARRCLKVNCASESTAIINDLNAMNMGTDLYKRYTNNNWHTSKELYGRGFITDLQMKHFKHYRFLTYSPILTGALMNAIASMKLKTMAVKNGMQMVLLQRNGGAGSQTLTSDIDVNTSGYGTAVIVQTFNSMFRQNYEKESGSFFDINVYGLDYLWFPLTDINHQPLVPVVDICSFSNGRKLAAAEAINDMFAIAKFYRFLKESAHTLLDQDPEKQLDDMYGHFLSALPDSAQAVARTAMEYVDGWIKQKHEVVAEVKKKRFEARKAEIANLAHATSSNGHLDQHTFLASASSGLDKEEKDKDKEEESDEMELESTPVESAAYESSDEESVTLVSKRLSADEKREVKEAEIEMTALNPVYEKMLYAVEALRLQLSAEQDAERRQNLQVRLAYLVSRALTWANEAYLSPGAVRYVVGVLQMRKSLKELGVTMNMILQALNEQAGDALKEIYMHILPRSNHVAVKVTVEMVHSMLMAATKYLTRLVEAAKQFYFLIPTPDPPEFKTFAEIDATLSLLDSINLAQQLLTALKTSSPNLKICPGEESKKGHKGRFQLGVCPGKKEEVKFTEEHEQVIFVRQVASLFTADSSHLTTHSSGPLSRSEALELVRQFRSGLVHATAAFNHYARNVKCPTEFDEDNPCISRGIIESLNTFKEWGDEAEEYGAELETYVSTLSVFGDPIVDCDAYQQTDRRAELLAILREALGPAVPLSFRGQAVVHTAGSYRKWKIASLGNPILQAYSKDDSVLEEIRILEARIGASPKRRASEST